MCTLFFFCQMGGEPVRWEVNLLTCISALCAAAPGSALRPSLARRAVSVYLQAALRCRLCSHAAEQLALYNWDLCLAAQRWVLPPPVSIASFSPAWHDGACELYSLHVICQVFAQHEVAKTSCASPTLVHASSMHAAERLEVIATVEARMVTANVLVNWLRPVVLSMSTAASMPDS